jgi:ABC-type xylose transport system permease subunit
MKNWPIYRNATLFLGGLAGVAHETLVATVERPTLLILFAAMMGLPAFLQQNNNESGPAISKQEEASRSAQ